ncbi:MAG: spore cortex-lytic enzyme [Clostridia bacterium]|nr:spore cortex-lytic enzyme [Clostridia bacterium]MCI9459155.1 spore cortex-lytic enzyme [Clostridia bacterium]
MVIANRKKLMIPALVAAALVAAVSLMATALTSAAYVVKGNSHANVAAVQTRLSTLGYYTSTVDGAWGSRTSAAVKKFQTAYGLKADGVVGGATERALGLSLPITGGITKGKTDFNVAAVQARLKTLGYYRSTVDGMWGKGTLTAVMRYQSDGGLAVDGVVGGGTARKLGITLYNVEKSGGIVKGKTAENIRKLQTALKSIGYYTSTVDGAWGRRTMCAVMSYQSDHGLTVDGVVGSATEKALGITLGTGSSGGTGSTGNVSESDLNLLARCVYGESRGEPYTGQVAVAAVVLNRVRSSKFPNTIKGVIYQAGAFTAVSDGQINLTPNQSAYNAARDALAGWDPTGGCLYYYNPDTATSSWIWSLTVHIKIGNHNFAL